MSEVYRPHSSEQLQAVFHAVEQHGPALTRIATQLGMTVGQVAGIKRRHRDGWDAALAAHQQHPADPGMDRPVLFEEEVSQRTGSAGDLDVRSKSRRIKTVEDLLRHIEADLARYEVASSEATKNEMVTKDPETGEIKITEYFRVWVKLRLRQGVDWMLAAESMLAAALRERKAPTIVTPATPSSEVWQVLPIADPHFGKYSWRGTTGYPDYDLEIAQKHVLQSGHELLQWGNETFRPERRTLTFLGDVFHYDTPHGTTTSGTPLERDGRMPKMVDIGTDTIMELIEASARQCPTDVLFVRGNHDEALTTFLQKTIREVFRHAVHVRVDNTHTHRKYLFHRGTLLGFTHGDKAKKRLPGLMPHEAKQWWHQATYYEWHTGHTHAMAAEWQRPIETIDGVLVRVSPAICPPDDWHADAGFVGALQAMETFFYRSGGGLLGMRVSSPTYVHAPSSLSPSHAHDSAAAC